ATIGAGVFDSNMAVDGMGTVECITAVYDKKSNDLNMGLMGYTEVPFFDKYCAYLVNFTGGSTIEWAHKELFQGTLSKQEMQEKVYEELNDHPSKVMVLPYFMGAGSPEPNENIKAAFLNIDLNTKSSEIYKGLLEGLAFEMQMNIDTMSR